MNDEQRLADRAAIESPNGEPIPPPEVGPAETAPLPARPAFDTAPDTTPAVAACRNDLTAAELLVVLAAVFPHPPAARHWLADPAYCGPIRVGLPPSLDASNEGRVWAAHAELRWQRQPDGRYRALYLADGSDAPAGWQVLARALRAHPGPPLRLWGEQGPDGRYWTRGRPAPLEYAGLPVQAGAAWVPCRYLLDAAGTPRFVRLALEETG